MTPKSRTRVMVASVIVLVDVFTNTMAAFLSMRRRLDRVAEDATMPMATVTIVTELLDLRGDPARPFWHNERLLVSGVDVSNRLSGWREGTTTGSLGEDCSVTSTCEAHTAGRWTWIAADGGPPTPVLVKATRTMTLTLSGDTSGVQVEYLLGPAAMPLDAILPLRVAVTVDVTDGDEHRYRHIEEVLVGRTDRERPGNASEIRFVVRPNATLRDNQLVLVSSRPSRGSPR